MIKSYTAKQLLTDDSAMREVIAATFSAVTSGQLSALNNNLSRYEAKYGIASADVHGAIDRGDLKETLDVCEWLMTYELLRRMQEVE